MNTTLYSKPQCGGCTATYAGLARRDIEHSTLDVTEDAEALAVVVGLGYQQMPVVVVRDADGAIVDHWSGYQPGKLNELADLLTQNLVPSV